MSPWLSPNVKKLKAKKDLAGLFEALKAQSDWKIRAEAVETLGDMDHPEVIDDLEPLLDDKKREVRLAALKALENLGWMPKNDIQRVKVHIIRKEWGALMDMGERAVPGIIEQLGVDDDDNLFQHLNGVLNDIGDPAVKPLLKALDRSDEKLVHNCIYALGELSDDRAIHSLHKMLKTSSPHLVDSLTALSSIGSPESTQRIFEIVKKLSDGSLALPFIVALARIDDRTITDDVVRMVKSEGTTSSKRTALLFLLLLMKDERAPELVFKFSERLEDVIYPFTRETLVSCALEAKGHPNSEVEVFIHKRKLSENDLTGLTATFTSTRAEAAEALGKTGDKRAVGPLIERLKVEKDSRVLYNILEALGELGDPKAVPAIVKLAHHPEDTVRLSVVMALARVGLNNKAAERIVIEALDESDWSFRLAAIDILANIGGYASVDALARTLNDEDMWIRSASAESLGFIDDPRTTGLLVSALKDRFGAVRKSAVDSLGFKKDKRNFELIAGRLKDRDRYVRGAAVDALARLGDERAVPLSIEMLEDKNRFVRRSAVVALAAIGDAACVKHLTMMLDDEPPIARHAREAIEEIRKRIKEKEALIDN